MIRVALIALWMLGYEAIAVNYDQQCAAIYREIAHANSVARSLIEGGETIHLRAVTINLGLANSFLAYVPHYNERRAGLVQALATILHGPNPPGVVFLQELWYFNDFELILKAFTEGPDSSYLAAVPRKAWHEIKGYGIQILVHRSILENGGSLNNVQKISFGRFRTLIDRIVGIFHGVLLVEITLNSGQTIILANTHLSSQAGEAAIRVRHLQTDSIIKAIQNKSKAQYVLLGGDFNASPEYADALPGSEASWENNRQIYMALYGKTHLVDTFRAVRKEAGYTWDKRQNELVANGSPFIRHEPLQRVDFLFFGERDARELSMDDFYVDESHLIFTDRIIPTSDGNLVHVSDHFGLYSTIVLRAP